MAPDPAATSEFSGGEVMASVDAQRLVIADLDRDDAWIEMGLSHVAPLTKWR